MKRRERTRPFAAVFRVASMPTEEFAETYLEGMTTQERRDGLDQGKDVPRMWNRLGRKNGVSYAAWADTGFQAAVIDEEKYALFQQMSADWRCIPPTPPPTSSLTPHKAWEGKP